MEQVPDFRSGRHAGILLPLFSCPSRRSWGIGEIGDLPAVARWLREAGLDMLQMLPLNEMANGQQSPYSALSAMAIDPIYIAIEEIPEFYAIGGEESMSPAARERLEHVRKASSIQYAEVRQLKTETLTAIYAAFRAAGPNNNRAKAFERFRADERWWVEDYALYRTLHEHNEMKPWWEWEPALANRDPEALARARQMFEGDIRYYAFLQWLAQSEWKRSKRQSVGIGLFGDLPFMVGADSADVWANQHVFARDLSVGTPPDAFSATGQDWGLPAYRWDAMAADNFRWLRDRARRARDLFDGFRVDHVIGFYRTYVRPTHGDPFFTPANEPDQIALGERVMRIFTEGGATVIAEDLGTVPNYLRPSLERLGVPGYKVFRWEREWNAPGQPFRDPAGYPTLSLATTGTHDTDPLAIWWQTASHDERRDVIAVSGFPKHITPEWEFNEEIRDAVLQLLLASGSNLLVLPMQDIFGWPDRINTPATVTDHNWTWRLPWLVSDMLDIAEAKAHAAALREWSARANRGPVPASASGRS
jgi:4-alpha-glucanotransferase